MNFEENIKHQFDRAATAYSTSPIFAKGHDLTLMVETASPTADMILLDVACAAGHTAFAFAAKIKNAIAIDLSEGMLVAAKQLAAEKNITNVHFQEASAIELPFIDRTFDIVTCRYAAHHFPSLPPILNEMIRVLKPGGQLLIVDAISPEESNLAAFINQVELLRDPSHNIYWKLSEWQATGKILGMPFVIISQWNLPINFADWTARQQTPAAAILQLENIFDEAEKSVRSAFSIVGPPARSFLLPSALLQARKSHS
ncbi:methyltransferase [Oscillatoriales cyanobacterium USR001]|nr:methyltransferase [Oscillatoriales cyanobacterium USR001]